MTTWRKDAPIESGLYVVQFPIAPSKVVVVWTDVGTPYLRDYSSARNEVGSLRLPVEQFAKRERVVAWFGPIPAYGG